MVGGAFPNTTFQPRPVMQFSFDSALRITRLGSELANGFVAHLGYRI